MMPWLETDSGEERITKRAPLKSGAERSRSAQRRLGSDKSSPFSFPGTIQMRSRVF